MIESQQFYKNTIENLTKLIIDFLSKNNYDEPVVNYISPQELEKQIDFSLPEYSNSIEQIFELIKSYLQFCVKTGHPQYFNQLWSGFNLIGFSGEVLTALKNTSIATYEIAPVATLIENAVIQRILELSGLSENGMGTFVTGGSK